MAFQGTIIEYIDNGKFVCGFVTAESDKRLNILTQTGRDANLPIARVVHRGDRHVAGLSREAILGRLQEVARLRQLLMSRVTLDDVWHLVIEGSDTVFEPRFLAELCFGEETTENHIAAFLRAVFQDRLYFKYKDSKIVCHSPEMVEQLEQRREMERHQENFLAHGAACINRIWQGDAATDWPERDTSLEIIKNFYLFGNDAPQSDLATKLLKRAGLTSPNDGYHLLVKAGIWDKNENIPLLRNGIEVDFPNTVLEQAAALTEPNPDALLSEGRQDLRDLELLTIDGKNTRDFDDALHIEQQGDNSLVGVHITDVTRVIKPGCPLFEEALARGISIYFAEGTVPMLPESLSEGLLSLIAGRPRAAMSFMILLSPLGEVLDFRVLPSVVEVKRQLHYGEVDGMIGSDKELTTLSQLSYKLRERRVTAGALILPFPDVTIQTDGADGLDVTLSDSDSPSRLLVSEFMILANTLAAQYLAEREIPGLFRSQPAPRRRLAEGYVKDLFLNTRQRKLLSPMTLSVKANPHRCLGVQQYTTITSPIRRLLDLLMQHQLLYLVTQNGALFSKKELKTYSAAITTLLTRANAAKQLRHRYWILKFLEPLQGRQVKGLIIDKGPRRVHVLLQDVMLDADLPASQAGGVSAGETIPVRIAHVDALNNILRIEL
jgi:exoribonuclease-2